ncbi:Oidioi.mRNA.OKI2018_I69.XSR.g13260.t1.cds [Oikopleura dioica]|uniref:NADH dehydrogenase [ubiquinone] 1 alpha subcomplex subunit 13 n=1 Tax=Oikopleura dioica TaxID=34765 RepID=A0ABN7S6D6_OIKDI|nr:Oidioi.mRNA.OKI2018_I69.XSR.g13260.t1.cds [Oikopleura dioica]
MNRLLCSRSTCARLFRSAAYRQDMPPPGGYPQMPWRRNIPHRGMSYIHMLVAGFVAYWLERTVTSRRVQWEQESFWEGQNIDMACMPLYEAEIDRDELRSLKEQMEGEAVNIVASGFDPTWKVGGHGIGDNGNPEYWPSNGYTSPYNLAIFKNFEGERAAKTHSWSHQSMALNSAMGLGAGKFEHVGPRGTF